MFMDDIVVIRRALWQDLCDIGKMICVPWQGDFNAIMSNGDRVEGNFINELATKKFQDWVIKSNIQELMSISRKFSWRNNEVGDKQNLQKDSQEFC